LGPLRRLAAVRGLIGELWLLPALSGLVRVLPCGLARRLVLRLLLVVVLAALLHTDPPRKSSCSTEGARYLRI
jgi:hypothetical protein